MDKGTSLIGARVRIRDSAGTDMEGVVGTVIHHSTELVATSKVTVQIDHHHEHNDASATRTVDVDVVHLAIISSPVTTSRDSHAIARPFTAPLLSMEQPNTPETLGFRPVRARSRIQANEDESEDEEVRVAHPAQAMTFVQAELISML